MSEMNPERHYYLYAKGHYKQASLEMDLIEIQSNYCNVGAESLSIRDVNCILQRLAYSQVKSENGFNMFMDCLRGQSCFGSFELSVARACLVIISNATVMDIGFVLGNADPLILPLNEVTDGA